VCFCTNRCVVFLPLGHERFPVVVVAVFVRLVLSLTVTAGCAMIMMPVAVQRLYALEWRAAPLLLRTTTLFSCRYLGHYSSTLLTSYSHRCTCPSPWLFASCVPSSLDLQREVGSLVDEGACPRERRTHQSTNPPAFHRGVCCMRAAMATCRPIIVAWYVAHTISDRNALTTILITTRRHK
jgi:hypothetical protein